MPSIHYEVLYLLVRFAAQQPQIQIHIRIFLLCSLGSARLPVVVVVVVSRRFVRRRVAVGNNFNFWSLNSFWFIYFFVFCLCMCACVCFTSVTTNMKNICCFFFVLLLPLFVSIFELHLIFMAHLCDAKLFLLCFMIAFRSSFFAQINTLF